MASVFCCYRVKCCISTVALEGSAWNGIVLLHLRVGGISLLGGPFFSSTLHHLCAWSRLDSKWEEERKLTIIDLLCQSLNRFLLKQMKACLTGLENMNVNDIMYCPLCNCITLGDRYSKRQNNIIPSCLNPGGSATLKNPWVTARVGLFPSPRQRTSTS